MLHPGTRVERVERAIQGVAVHIGKQGETESIKGSHLLVATGRKPNVKGLSLERAGIVYDADGIKVNQQLKTSNPRIYAIGDVIGGAAIHPPRQLSRRHRDQERAVPLRPRRERRRHSRASPIPTPSLPRSASPRPRRASEISPHPHLALALCRQRPGPGRERRPHGFIKVITRPNGTILGCTIVGAEAGELLQLWVMALARDMQDRRPDRRSCCLIPPFPSSQSAWPIPLSTFLDQGWFRRLIDLLRRFG